MRPFRKSTVIVGAFIEEFVHIFLELVLSVKLASFLPNVVNQTFNWQPINKQTVCLPIESAISGLPRLDGLGILL